MTKAKNLAIHGSEVKFRLLEERKANRGGSALDDMIAWLEEGGEERGAEGHVSAGGVERGATGGQRWRLRRSSTVPLPRAPSSRLGRLVFGGLNTSG